MASLKNNGPVLKGAVLLLGPPGVGKSLLGHALCAAHPASIHAFLNIGQQLRSTGKVHEYLLHPSVARKAELQRLANSQLRQALQTLQNASLVTGNDGLVWPQVLLLECVKEVDDAFTLVELLQEYNLPLLQVLYIPDDRGTTTDKLREHHRRMQAASAGSSASFMQESEQYDRERLVQERQHKWRLNAAALIEFFSSLGVLVEISAACEADAGVLLQHRPREPRPQPSLKAIGYAACHSDSSSTSSGGSTGSGNSSSSTDLCLHRMGWCVRGTNALSAFCSSWPIGSEVCLVATLIQPVVSQRLVTSAAERDRVIGFAAAHTELWASCTSSSSSSAAMPSPVAADAAQHIPDGSPAASSSECCAVKATSSSSTSVSSRFASLIAVPSQAITTLSDARWVAVPDRYMVSLKCDGTRCLLITTDALGYCYLLNRAGMLYKYPVSNAHTRYQAVTHGPTAEVCDSPASTSCASRSVASAPASLEISSTDDNTASQEPPSSSTAAVHGESKVAPAGDAVRSSKVAYHCSNRAQSILQKAQKEGPAIQDRVLECSLPAGTILDGELVWLEQGKAGNKQGYFLVFDALAVGRQQLWRLPLTERLEGLQELLQLPEAGAAAAAASARTGSNTADEAGAGAGNHFSLGIENASKKEGDCSQQDSTVVVPAISSQSDAADAAASTTVVNTANDASSSSQQAARLNKRQQSAAVGSDSITLLYKPHHDVSAAVLQQLEASLSTYPFPTDGVVFTPKAMPYVLGMSQLLTKWQPAQQTAIDITASQLEKLLQSSSFFSAPEACRKEASRVEKLVKHLPPHLVYECSPLIFQPSDSSTLDRSRYAGRRSSSAAKKQNTQYMVWEPMSVRWDKSVGNDATVRQQLEHESWQISHEQLVQAVWEVESYLSTAPQSSNTDSSGSSSSSSALSPAAVPAAASQSRHHPARSTPFAQLYAAVMAEVAAGTVECTCDASTGLEVFCYHMTLGPPNSATAAMCRGLVLHPASCSTVATPFLRFGEAETKHAEPIQHTGQAAAEACNSGHWDSSSSGGGGTSAAVSKLDQEAPHRSRGKKAKMGSSFNRQAATGRRGSKSVSKAAAVAAKQPASPDDVNLQLYRSWAAQPAASASVKLDGSFIIAYLWDGELKVNTRRRMDSEQALWSADWLQSHANITAMQPGWTYMFEAIYQHNTHVVQYPFECLVLLGVVSPDGQELAAATTLQQLAMQLGVMVVPCLKGTLPELVSKLGQRCNLQGSSSAAASSASTAKMSCERFTASNKHSQQKQQSKPANFEGWVVQHSGQRYKLVLNQFKQAAFAVHHLLQPLLVWDAVFCGCSRAEIAHGLPSHFVAELDAILTALEGNFHQVQQHVGKKLQEAWLIDGQRGLPPPPSSSSSAAAAAATTDIAAGDAPAGPAEEDEQCSAAVMAQQVEIGPAAGSGNQVVATTQQLTARFAGMHLAAESVTSKRVSCSIALAEQCPASVTSVIHPTTSSSNTVAPQLPDSCAGPAMVQLLEYATAKGTAAVPSMFRSSTSSTQQHPASALRGLILEVIRPDSRGTLPGYTPSPAFHQTYAKGWAKGPQGNCRVSVTAPESLIQQHLTDQAMMAVLSCLSGGSVGRAMLTCRAWNKLIQADPVFQSQAAAAAQKKASRYYADYYSCYDTEYSDYDDYDYHDRYHDHSDWSSCCGYGSR